MNALYPVICANDVAQSRDFYVRLFGLDVVFDSGWYAQLIDPKNPGAQLGIVERHHATVPEGFHAAPAGVLISVEVPDAAKVYAQAREAGLRIAMELRDEEFGQLHFMAVDPDGLLVDVIELIPMRGEFAGLEVAGLELNGSGGVAVDR